MANPITFDYDAAFSRNIGWVTEAEQGKLRKARVAIAGLGGVGGAHLLTLSISESVIFTSLTLTISMFIT